LNKIFELTFCVITVAFIDAAAYSVFEMRKVEWSIRKRTRR